MDNQLRRLTPSHTAQKAGKSGHGGGRCRSLSYSGAAISSNSMAGRPSQWM